MDCACACRHTAQGGPCNPDGLICRSYRASLVGIDAEVYRQRAQFVHVQRRQRLVVDLQGDKATEIGGFGPGLTATPPPPPGTWAAQPLVPSA